MSGLIKKTPCHRTKRVPAVPPMFMKASNMPTCTLYAVTGLPGRPYFIFRRPLQREIQQVAFKLALSTCDTNSLFEEAKAYLISFIAFLSHNCNF